MTDKREYIDSALTVWVEAAARDETLLWVHYSDPSAVGRLEIFRSRDMLRFQSSLIRYGEVFAAQFAPDAVRAFLSRWEELHGPLMLKG